MSSAVVPPARAAARQLRDRWGRLTAARRVTPTFLVVGAQRCGTTTLYRTLSQHPAVLPAVWRKGIHYFDTGYARGPDWYRSHFVTRAAAEQVRSRQGAFATGESSPYYLFHPLAASRIAADLPDVRVLVLLRDPVERAYSAWSHERARGFEDRDFAAALAAEPDRLAGQEARLVADPTAYSHSHQHHGYLARGRYAGQLERLERAVGRDRLHVIDSADFWADPAPAFAQVLGFLDLPDWRPDGFGRFNARSRSPMDDALRHRLQRELEDDDARLAAWWGRVPSWRR